MQTYQLLAHPDFPPNAVQGIRVEWDRSTVGLLTLRYQVERSTALILPAQQVCGRGDKLWEATCFELFLADQGKLYREYNFSPSGQWAAYGFDDYRTLRGHIEVGANPKIHCQRSADIFTLSVQLNDCELVTASRASLSAVIVEDGGQTSYWALAHGGQKPDFHDPTCFQISLPPADKS